MPWKTLASVLDETRAMLSRPGNVYSSSHWGDQAEAIADIDAARKSLTRRKTEDLRRVRLLFAPRGPVQQVSIATGWGADFLRLAQKFDRAMGAILFPRQNEQARNGG